MSVGCCQFPGRETSVEGPNLLNDSRRGKDFRAQQVGWFGGVLEYFFFYQVAVQSRILPLRHLSFARYLGSSILRRTKDSSTASWALPGRFRGSFIWEGCAIFSAVRAWEETARNQLPWTNSVLVLYSTPRQLCSQEKYRLKYFQLSQRQKNIFITQKTLD